jgi:hypothetical protein
MQIENEQQLEAAFYGIRQGPYGSFEFSHAAPFPSLCILINDSAACIHYFPSEGHPGFHSIAEVGSQPSASDETLHFRQFADDDGSSFDLPVYMTVPVEVALSAAKQFLSAPSLPNCIQWEEL